MKRKRLLFLGATLVALIGCYFLAPVVFTSPEAGPTRENFMRLQKGMAYMEVWDILGPTADGGGQIWNGQIHLVFDSNQKLVDGEFVLSREETLPLQTSVLGWLRQKLGS